ncbi:ABC-three component system middle component 2 [Dyadobacter sp. LHD-138]|uniref:ABC-three component system middle component 2 n=1 Tax=Dyadobacter sp. LHD-138 TaxID=3071413 RepID=UPI0027E004EE|nr:ABC-three component system middle component 2 [Dyadobacter sp. LHD-138]MDQ6481829.1 hypothetical protein [Dyadobacter sp. LHD-138]
MENNTRLFNTPLEIGLRLLVLLSQSQTQMDSEKLMYLDFLCLNTFDIGGPESLHAPIPNRGVQVFAKKELIQRGLAVMLSKELIAIIPTEKGFLYYATDAGRYFLQYFQTPYYSKLVEKSSWVVSLFDEESTQEIKKYIDDNLSKWGGEFVEAAK